MRTRSFAPVVFLFLLITAAGAATPVKEEWLQVQSKNFNLIGNASEKDIRRVATKLEQFREVFRQLFNGSKVDADIPTNVVVFRSDSAYKPFKPKRGDGKIDDFIAGYFQPGDDVNYITLSVGGTDAEMFGTIFHEYVHFVVDTNIGKQRIPAWFNEGLAEYYQTFEIEDDIKAKVGIPQGGHLALLQQSKLIPLDTFFNTSNASLLGHGSGARSIFYAQAWAVMHYLIANNKSAGIDKFLALSIKDTVDERAFQEAFQMSYAQMEKELRKYVARGTYSISVATFKKKLTVDDQIRVTPLSAADSNAFLGDLLYHIHRPDDAEAYLQTALTADPDHGLANTAMGMVRVRQRKYSDARSFLDKAIAKDPRNHIAYYQLAYILSREFRDELGYVSSFPAELANRMRELLNRAIQLKPGFTESYELLAFVSLVTNDKIEEGLAAMTKALQYRPGNQRYALRIAELYIRQDKLKEASDLASRIAKNSDEPQTKSQAENLLQHINARNEMMARNEEARKKYDAAIAAGAKDGGTQTFVVRRGPGGKEPTPEDIKRQSEEFEVRAINRELRKVGEGEVRLIGKLGKIDCKGGKITYTVSSEQGAFTLTSKDFQGLTLSSYVVDAGNAEIGCDAKPSTVMAVLTYKPHPAKLKAATRGDLLSVEYVPAHFRFVDASAEPEAAVIGSPSATEGTIDISGSQPGSPVDNAAERRDFIFDQVRAALRKPGPGEKRVFGFVERSECSNKGALFFIKAGSQLLKFNGAGGRQPEIRGFTQEIEDLQFGCGMKAIDVPVVVTYRESTDKKLRSDGDLVALEFVPKGFVPEL